MSAVYRKAVRGPDDSDWASSVYANLSVLQNLLKNAGGFNKPTVFLITDSQFKEEVFLEDIDSLLNASEVPNLFTPDEKVEVIEVSTSASAKKHIPPYGPLLTPITRPSLGLFPPK